MWRVPCFVVWFSFTLCGEAFSGQTEAPLEAEHRPVLRVILWGFDEGWKSSELSVYADAMFIRQKGSLQDRTAHGFEMGWVSPEIMHEIHRSVEAIEGRGWEQKKDCWTYAYYWDDWRARHPDGVQRLIEFVFYKPELLTHAKEEASEAATLSYGSDGVTLAAASLAFILPSMIPGLMVLLFFDRLYR